MRETELILLALLTISLLIVGALLFQRNRRMSQQQQSLIDLLRYSKNNDVYKAIIETQEQERNRIAGDLHDSVGAELSMIKLNLSKFAYSLNKKNIHHKPLSEEMDNLDQAIEHIRSICRDLYPVTLQSYGFIRTFEELVTKINSRSNIVCKYRINLKETDLFPELENKLNLLRLFQEVINNLIKYSQCTTLDIGFMKYDNTIKIILRHDGIGFDNEKVHSLLNRGTGVGLASINNRIHLMTGTINYSQVNKGSEIIIELPSKNG